MRRSIQRHFSVLIILACLGSAQTTSPDDGSIQGNTYTNFFFRVRYEFSPSWVPQSAAANRQLREVGRQRLERDSVTHSGAAADNKSFNLLTLYRHLPGMSGSNRAIIMLVAEDITSEPETVNARECVLKLAEKMKQTHYQPVGDPQELQISAKSFFRQDLKGISTAGAPVRESLVLTTSKGYALLFIIAAPNEAILANSLGTLSSVQFF